MGVGRCSGKHAQPRELAILPSVLGVFLHPMTETVFTSLNSESQLLGGEIFLTTNLQFGEPRNFKMWKLQVAVNRLKMLDNVPLAKATSIF